MTALQTRTTLVRDVNVFDNSHLITAVSLCNASWLEHEIKSKFFSTKTKYLSPSKSFNCIKPFRNSSNIEFAYTNDDVIVLLKHRFFHFRSRTNLIVYFRFIICSQIRTEVRYLVGVKFLAMFRRN